jgi:anti-anti-sigma regulatory factor
MSIVKTSQVQGRQPVTILHVLDRINLGNVDQLEQAAREAYQQGNTNLLIDMTQVPSITSAGLRAIVIIHKIFSSESPDHAGAGTKTMPPDKPSKSANLKLFNVSPEIRNVLRMTGFEDFLEIFNNQEEAIASF